MEQSFIGLMTDFGEDDFFVASLRGVIANINPSAHIVDITHRVSPFDIAAASFILRSCYKYFPAGTIFLIIVDPTVGSSRRILLAETKRYFFIAPDNGVLSLVLEEENRIRLRELKNKKYFLPELSRTFEGRDKMAPVAAWLSKGVSSNEFGPLTSEYKRFHVQRPELEEGEIVGRVLYADRFGNLITNIPESMLKLLQNETGLESFVLNVGGKEIFAFGECYSGVERGMLLFLVGSLGLIEIAARESSASRKLKVLSGDEVRIVAVERPGTSESKQKRQKRFSRKKIRFYVFI